MRLEGRETGSSGVHELEHLVLPSHVTYSSEWLLKQKPIFIRARLQPDQIMITCIYRALSSRLNRKQALLPTTTTLLFPSFAQDRNKQQLDSENKFSVKNYSSK